MLDLNLLLIFLLIFFRVKIHHYGLKTIDLWFGKHNYSSKSWDFKTLNSLRGFTPPKEKLLLWMVSCAEIINQVSYSFSFSLPFNYMCDNIWGLLENVQSWWSYQKVDICLQRNIFSHLWMLGFWNKPRPKMDTEKDIVEIHGQLSSISTPPQDTIIKFCVI